MSWHAGLPLRPDTAHTRLLPDAELPEYDVQDVVRVQDTDQLAQSFSSRPHVDRSDARRQSRSGERLLEGLEFSDGRRRSCSVTRTREHRDLVFRHTAVNLGDSRIDRVEQGMEPFAGSGADGDPLLNFRTF